MATKDFKVKNGLSVGENIVVNQNINVVGDIRSVDSSGVEKIIVSTDGDFTGKYAGFDSDFNVSFQNVSTDSLSEGLINLYYTDSRVLTYLTANSYAKIEDIDSAISALIDAAPEQLDTLNELAAAINDDSDFAGTITTLIGTKVSKSEFGTFFDSNFSLKTTTDLLEGNNLYYTTDRVDSDIISLVDSSYIESRRPSEAIFDVVNNSTVAYTFTGDGFPIGVDNPSLYLQKGMTYKFRLNASGHPFEIRVSDGGAAYSSGVTNNSIETGEILFTVPMDAPDTLYYQCTIHSVMGGTIYVTEAASINTDQISEGITNLYYTSARVDSDILSFVDSSYIQARQADIFRDSGFVTGIIDSSYINSRVVIPEAGVDSVSVTNIITNVVDSSYINSRVDIAGGSGGATNLNDLIDVDTTGLITGSILKYNGSQWVVGVDNTGSGGAGGGTVDSSQTISLITDTVDSAYVQARAGDGTSIYYLSDVEFKNYKFISDSNQTVFTGIDAYGSTLALESNQFQVYINGIRISQTDFTNTTTTLTLSGSVNNNDEVVVTSISQVSDNVAFTAGVDTFYYVASQDQTVFTGNDANGVSLDYSPGSIQVYLNGILLIDSADYTATDGSTLTLLDPSNLSDQLYIVSHIPSNIYTIQNLVDSAYINARVVIPDAGIDSASVTNIIDSAYVSARFDLDTLGELGEGQVETYLYTADSGQTVFSGVDDNGATLSYNVGQVQLFLNGVLLVNSLDYTATTGNSITLIDPADSADQLVVNSFSAYFSSLAQSYTYLTDGYFTNYEYTADSGQSIFSGSDVNGNVLSFDSNNYQVFINGFRIGVVDFTANPIDNTITLSPSAESGDEIAITVFKTEVLSQTLDSEISNVINTLTPGIVDSYAAQVFDSDYVQSKLTFNIAQSTIDFYRFVASGAQTDFTGTDAFGNTLLYRPNNASVYYNGSLLTNTLDYTATDGTSIQLTLAADSGDEISVVNYNQSFIADVDSSVITSIIDSNYISSRYSPIWSEVTTNINATAGQKLILDTNNVITVTLPAVATLGDEIRIIDGAGNAGINNITINRNGHRIQGNDSDLTIDINRAAFGLVYYNESNGWLFTEV